MLIERSILNNYIGDVSELAYGTGFENQRGVKPTKGSNPFISSILNGVVGKLVTPPDCKSEA